MAALTLSNTLARRRAAAIRAQQARTEQANIAGTALGQGAFGAYGSATPAASSGMMLRQPPMWQGQYNTQYGVNPMQASPDQFIAATSFGGQPSMAPGALGMPNAPGPYIPAYRQQMAAGAAGGGVGGNSMLSGLYGQLSYDDMAANAANEARYAQGLQELTGLRDRNQAGWAGWGTAAKGDIDDDLHAALSRAKADMASRGIANSNTLPAFDLKRSQYATREQQRVGENQAAHQISSDTQDTNNKVGFIERRVDDSVDPSVLISLAEKLGAAGVGGASGAGAAGSGGMTPADQVAAARARIAGGGNRNLLQRYPGSGGLGSNWNGGINWMNGTPGEQGMGLLGSIVNLGPHGSNRYPTHRLFDTVAKKRYAKAFREANGRPMNQDDIKQLQEQQAELAHQRAVAKAQRAAELRRLNQVGRRHRVNQQENA